MKRILFIVAIFATVSLTSCTAPSTSDSSQVKGPDTTTTPMVVSQPAATPAPIASADSNQTSKDSTQAK